MIAQGLELELVVRAHKGCDADALARVPDVRAARAFATWVTRLAAHYEAQGIIVHTLARALREPAEERDLAVLAMCLMEQVDGAETRATQESSEHRDPIAVLDATLALFQKLPVKARGILGNLRRQATGEGRRLFPDLAAWLDDDESSIRCIHSRASPARASCSGRDPRGLRARDAQKGERAHLATLGTRSPPQQARLDMLLRAERHSPAPRAVGRSGASRSASSASCRRPTGASSTARSARSSSRLGDRRAVADAGVARRRALLARRRRQQGLLGRLLREAANAPGRD